MLVKDNTCHISERMHRGRRLRIQREESEHMYERRTLVTINTNYTTNQAGGRKGMSTTDHILKIKELINHNKTNKKNTYITFLDVTKAYDKAWLDAIMYVKMT